MITIVKGTEYCIDYTVGSNNSTFCKAKALSQSKRFPNKWKFAITHLSSGYCCSGCMGSRKNNQEISYAMRDISNITMTWEQYTTSKAEKNSLLKEKKLAKTMELETLRDALEDRGLPRESLTRYNQTVVSLNIPISKLIELLIK
jgi:hypothetical protein